MINKYYKEDIETVVLDLFHSQSKPEHRYASFDYCFNYFQDATADEMESDKQKACLQLGFYLASWGMLRGSSFMLQKSIKHYIPLIDYIITLKRENHIIWNIDTDTYTKQNIKALIVIYNEVKRLIIGDEGAKTHLTLVTKILLGVFGCIPAYDQYFTDSFRAIFKDKYRCGFRSLSNDSLSCISEFYVDNKESIDKLHEEINTISFDTGELTSNKYTKAKIIDMYGFAKAMYQG